MPVAKALTGLLAQIDPSRPRDEGCPYSCCVRTRPYIAPQVNTRALTSAHADAAARRVTGQDQGAARTRPVAALT